MGPPTASRRSPSTSSTSARATSPRAGLVPEGTPPDQADAYKIKIGYNPVAGTRRTIVAPREWWKVLAVLALGVVCLEWYIYNRRVYI